MVSTKLLLLLLLSIQFSNCKISYNTEVALADSKKRSNIQEISDYLNTLTYDSFVTEYKTSKNQNNIFRKRFTQKIKDYEKNNITNFTNEVKKFMANEKQSKNFPRTIQEYNSLINQLRSLLTRYFRLNKSVIEIKQEARNVFTYLSVLNIELFDKQIGEVITNKRFWYKYFDSKIKSYINGESRALKGDSEFLVRYLKNIPYPTDKDAQNFLIEDMEILLKRYFKARLQITKIDAGQKNLQYYLDLLSYDYYTKQFPKNKCWYCSYCAKLKEYTFNDKLIASNFEKICTKILFKNKNYPKNREIFEKTVLKESQTFVKNYFDHIKTSKTFIYEVHDIKHFFGKIIYPDFTETYSKKPIGLWKKMLTSSLREVPNDNLLKKLGDFLIKNLVLFEYPKNKIEYKAFKKRADDLLKLYKNYFQLKSDFENLEKTSELYIRTLTMHQISLNLKENKQDLQTYITKSLKTLKKLIKIKKFNSNITFSSTIKKVFINLKLKNTDITKLKNGNKIKNHNQLKKLKTNIINLTTSQYRSILHKIKKNFAFKIQKFYWTDITYPQFKKIYDDKEKFEETLLKNMGDLLSENSHVKKQILLDIIDSLKFGRKTYPSNEKKQIEFKKNFLEKLKRKLLQPTANTK